MGKTDIVQEDIVQIRLNHYLNILFYSRDL